MLLLRETCIYECIYLWVQIHIREPVCGCRVRHSDVLPQDPSAFLFWGKITHWPGLGSSNKPVWLTSELQESTYLFPHSIGITNHVIWILGLKFMSLFMKGKNSVDRELPTPIIILVLKWSLLQTRHKSSHQNGLYIYSI